MHMLRVDFLNRDEKFNGGVDFPHGSEGEFHGFGYTITYQKGYKNVPMTEIEEYDEQTTNEPMKIKIQFIDEKTKKIMAETIVYGSDAVILMLDYTIVVRKGFHNLYPLM